MKNTSHVTFEMSIESGNEAMVNDTIGEITSMLHATAKDIYNGKFEGKLRDINGNTVGMYSLAIFDE